ncbi:MAG: ATP-binding protein [Planctomycetota bacterium]
MALPDYEKTGSFYLGKEHDLSSDETSGNKLLYDSKDLTTHAVCVGMTGSGKTGLCLSLLEEAALDGVPAICIDPKGDLGNLMLGFADFDPAKFTEWVDPASAQRKGLSVEQMGAKTAELWKHGLADWDQDGERVQRYNHSVERLIFTPGASHGIPMTVLKSFDAPPKQLRDDADAFRARVSSAVSGLLALLGIDADPVRSREHIFLSNIITHAWNAGNDLDVGEMIAEIQSPPFDKVGVMDLETFYPGKERTKLAMDLNNLLASPAFAGWMTGQPLDVQQLFFSPEGKPRHSIISIAHLDDAQRMFFVTILLNEVLAWTRSQSGTSNLRALLYMDEVFGYFPPTANPPSKQPMLTLLKQARAFGLGVVLATQNPVDLDYKGLSNTGTWLLGRLQTERDKMRVMEGLEGASAEAGGSFDKQAMERTLAGLGSRVFLMNNVHEDAPQVFHTRWAMSYLAGPLARDRIKQLMDPVREKFLPPPEPEKNPREKANPKAEDAEAETQTVDADEPAAHEIASASDRAKIEAGYASKIDKALTREKKAHAYYREQFWQVPGKLFALVFRGIALLLATISGGATKRKSSSAMAAFERTVAEISQANTAWGKLRSAQESYNELEREKHAKLGGESSPKQLSVSLLMHPMIWILILVAVALVAVIAGVALVVGSGGNNPPG